MGESIVTGKMPDNRLREEDGVTPLMKAGQSEDINAMKKLIQQGVRN